MHIYQVEALVCFLEERDLFVGDEHVNAGGAVTDDCDGFNLVLLLCLLTLLLVEVLAAVRSLSLLWGLVWATHFGWYTQGYDFDWDRDAHPRL